MDPIADKITPRGVTVFASAPFTSDMAKNLVTIFDNLTSEETVDVKFSNKGVWAVTPLGVRLFLGSTEVFSVGDDDAPKKFQ